MTRPDRARLLRACTLIAVVAACGGGEPSPTAKKAQPARTTGGEAALPALPDDPFALVPAGAQLVLTADLQTLRSSPHFPTLRRWVERETCAAPSTNHLLLDRAERLVLAGMSDPARPDDLQPLAIMRMRTTAPGDAAQLLDQHRALSGRPPHGAVEQARGRHAYVEAEGAAAARLGDRMLVVGNAAQVAAVIATADGKQPAFPHGDAQAAALRDTGWYAQHAVALGGRVSERGARRMARSLSGVGAQGAVTPLERGTLALALDLDSSLHALAQLDLADAATAHEAADSLRSTFSRLSLPLRLFGLPAALGSPRIHTDDRRLSLELTLTQDDLRTLLDKLELVIGSSPPACLQQQAALHPGAARGEG